MGLSRRIFTKEFKLAAVRRLEQGVSIGEAARALETCSTACCITATCSSVVRAVGALRPSRIRRKRNPDLLSPPFPFPPPGANRGGRVPPRRDTPRTDQHRCHASCGGSPHKRAAAPLCIPRSAATVRHSPFVIPAK